MKKAIAKGKKNKASQAQLNRMAKQAKVLRRPASYGKNARVE